jgi:hypothetical protein
MGKRISPDTLRLFRPTDGIRDYSHSVADRILRDHKRPGDLALKPLNSRVHISAKKGGRASARNRRLRAAGLIT